eukprot:616173-Lingulodinium_polyedra.AAC.1
MPPPAMPPPLMPPPLTPPSPAPPPPMPPPTHSTAHFHQTVRVCFGPRSVSHATAYGFAWSQTK